MRSNEVIAIVVFMAIATFGTIIIQPQSVVELIIGQWFMVIGWTLSRIGKKFFSK